MCIASAADAAKIVLNRLLISDLSHFAIVEADWRRGCYNSHRLPKTIAGVVVMNRTGTFEFPISRRSASPEMSELSLLLPSWQMRELADAADARGMTVGQFMRSFIQQMLQFPKIGENSI